MLSMLMALLFCFQGVEMTWVIADHVARDSSGELSVSKGQQVEVVEVQGGGEWCLVRMPSAGGGADSPPEGLVPSAVLKQPPLGLKTSPSRRIAASATAIEADSGKSIFTSIDKEDAFLKSFNELINLRNTI